jgi:hypothetical protein
MLVSHFIWSHILLSRPAVYVAKAKIIMNEKLEASDISLF